MKKLIKETASFYENRSPTWLVYQNWELVMDENDNVTEIRIPVEGRKISITTTSGDLRLSSERENVDRTAIQEYFKEREDDYDC